MKYQDSEIGYAAGLFDTTGNINILVPNDDISQASLFVWVTANSFKLMTILQRFGATIDRKGRQFKAKWKDHKAYSFLKLLLSHARVKRDQIEVGIEFFDSKLKNEDPQSYVLPLKVRLRLLKKDDLNT